MNEHLPKVLALSVIKLRNAQAPVKAELYNVVPPHVAVDGVMGVVVPAMFDVPQPRFRPKDQHTIEEDGCVIKTAPTEM